ncbi:thioredoxin family protein [Aestuariivivens sp. NBU2969]|uniref:thioredoxin family protein n=1 Tax=Aestuariivivens sp. NBU2969 TaxID=2873267 RepID=UPI001CBC9373|nr:thioredoxin family protein [Aestuariivivens sp. NBU2969]
MKRTLLIIFLLQFSIELSYSQTDCEKILSKEINLTFSEKSDLNILNDTFSKLTDCGLEQIDADFFTNGPILGTLLVPLISENNGKVTYQNLFDKIMEIKQTPQYGKTIELFKISNELEKRKADINNWEEDKLLLQKLQTSNEFIDKFYDYLKEHSNPEKTYKEVFANFRETQKPKQLENESSTKKEYNGIFKNAGNVNYEELLKKSIELKKPLLLYFTGYACVNARKIEHYVLSSSSITEKLKNEFYFVNLYVDDRKSLPENERTKSKTNEKPLKYIGQKHSELQITKFKNNFQPYFVIIDKNGNKIKEQGYTTDIKLFEEFLTIDK